MVEWIEHISHPGFGYIYPYMDEDDPLIHEDVGELLTETLNELSDDYQRLLSQYLDILNWHNEADRSAHSWAELDAIFERHDKDDEDNTNSND